MASVAHAQSEDIGRWTLSCDELEGKARCVATQVIAADPAAKQVVLGVTIEHIAGRQLPQLTFRFTNAALREAGAGLKIDDREPLRAPISACDDKVCEVKSFLAGDLEAQMTAGKMLTFAYFLAENRQQMSVPVSLDGVQQVMDELVLQKQLNSLRKSLT